MQTVSGISCWLRPLATYLLIFLSFVSVTNTNRPVYTIAVGTVAGSSSEDIGQALDVSITQKVSEKIEYGIGATLFEQGAYLKDQFGDRQLTDLYVVANINF